MASRHVRVVLPAMTAVFAAAAAHPAAGGEIYKWIDANGVVNYSESRPADPAAPRVETLYIGDTNPAGYDPAADYWSIVNQAERIAAEWTALREEREAEEAHQRARAAEQRVAELERRLAAAEAATYAARPRYTPFGLLAARHRFFGRDFEHRLHGRRPPPRRSRDAAGPRPGWPAPGEPSRPAAPGFGAPAGH